MIESWGHRIEKVVATCEAAGFLERIGPSKGGYLKVLVGKE
jgi:hypothetical protein